MSIRVAEIITYAHSLTEHV